MEEPLVIIIGAGPGGIATSASLTTHSIPHIILEREDCIAPLWQKYSYDRLHLHLRKNVCELPYVPFPSWYPNYVPKDLYIQYMNDFASHFNIRPLFSRNVEEAAFDEGAKKWVVKARNTASGEVEEYSSRFLVLATGNWADPFVPEVEGLRDFPGEVIHSTQYKNGKHHRGKNVLVVGSGNSGMEIALDLANHGANTSIVIRSPVHILTTWIMHLGLVMFKYVRVSVIDRILPVLSKLVYGDLSKYGIPTPEEGPFFVTRNYGKYPIVDMGTVQKIKSGEIQVLPAMERIKGNEVIFQNGKSYAFDTIIFCTGFKPSKAGNWFKEDECYPVTEGGGFPKPGFQSSWKGKNGLYCNGMARVGLHGIRINAQDIAKDIKSLLEN